MVRTTIVQFVYGMAEICWFLFRLFFFLLRSFHEAFWLDGKHCVISIVIAHANNMLQTNLLYPILLLVERGTELTYGARQFLLFRVPAQKKCFFCKHFVFSVIQANCYESQMMQCVLIDSCIFVTPEQTLSLLDMTY